MNENYFYKKILYRVIDDENYLKDLREIAISSTISLDDAIYWLKFIQILPNGKNYIKFICELANKGYNKKAIYNEMVKLIY
jgi:hypothetical protein